MSYILDALKRADAERVRGQVPGLHAHPLPEAGTRTAASGLPRWALIGGAGAGLVVIAALAWRMGADANAPLPVPMAEPSTATPAVPTAAPPQAESPPTAAPATHWAAPSPPTAPTPAPLRQPSPSPAVARVTAPPSPPSRVVPAPAPAPKPAATAEPAPAATIPTLAELPASLRKQLPPLSVSGSVYSDDAAARFIMLNGEVVKEGGQPAPGLVLERIEPKSAVLRFKGERFRLQY